jgi:hypothetical protein
LPQALVQAVRLLVVLVCCLVVFPLQFLMGLQIFLQLILPRLLRVNSVKRYITQPVNILGRELSPKTLQGALETTANLGSSIAAPFVVDAAVGKYLYPVPTVESQSQQIMQEMQQRAAVNQLEGPQAVAPGTQFQMQGIEHTFLRNYVKPQNYVPELMPGYSETLAQIQRPLG